MIATWRPFVKTWPLLRRPSESDKFTPTFAIPSLLARKMPTRDRQDGPYPCRQHLNNRHAGAVSFRSSVEPACDLAGWHATRQSKQPIASCKTDAMPTAMLHSSALSNHLDMKLSMIVCTKPTLSPKFLTIQPAFHARCLKQDLRPNDQAYTSSRHYHTLEQMVSKCCQPKET